MSKLLAQRALVDFMAVTGWLETVLKISQINDSEARQLTTEVLANTREDIANLRSDPGIGHYTTCFGEPPLDHLQELADRIQKRGNPTQIEEIKSELRGLRTTLEDRYYRGHGAERW